MTKYSSTITIMRISLVWLSVMVSVQAQNTLSGASRGVRASQLEMIEDIKADVGERNFWGGIALPSRDLRLVLFETASSSIGTGASFDALAILPDLNAIYKYRLCGRKFLSVGQEGGWLTWSHPGGKQVSPDEYLTKQLARFADFVNRAKRSDQALSIESDPSSLFHPDSVLRGQRVAQIKSAIRTLFHRPLKVKIAAFSQFTSQIHVLIPEIGEMVTISVMRPCSEAESVEVGREVPLKSVRKDLLDKIEVNSAVIAIK